MDGTNDVGIPPDNSIVDNTTSSAVIVVPEIPAPVTSPTAIPVSTSIPKLSTVNRFA